MQRRRVPLPPWLDKDAQSDMLLWCERRCSHAVGLRESSEQFGRFSDSFFTAAPPPDPCGCPLPRFPAEPRVKKGWRRLSSQLGDQDGLWGEEVGRGGGPPWTQSLLETVACPLPLLIPVAFLPPSSLPPCLLPSLPRCLPTSLPLYLPCSQYPHSPGFLPSLPSSRLSLPSLSQFVPRLLAHRCFKL